MAKGRGPFNVEFLKKLKDLLEIDTVSEFAGRCGQSVGNMSNYLSGQRTPGERVLRSCLSALMAQDVPSNVQFMKTLRDISGIDTDAAFARACGKSYANMSGYLSGRIVPGRKVVRDCARDLFSWDVESLEEIAPLKEVLLPEDPGVYVLYDSAPHVLYVGQAKSFKTEVEQTLSREMSHSIRFGLGLPKSTCTLRDLAHYVSLYLIPDPRGRHNVEALLIHVLINQTYNRRLETFRYAGPSRKLQR